jgi:uncharacterized membrane protein
VKAARILGTIHDFAMLNGLADTPPTREAIELVCAELRAALARPAAAERAWRPALRLAAATGMRSAFGPAALARARGGRAARLWTALAAGELVADKLPFTPSRLSWPVQVERALAGAWVGYAARSSRRWLGAIGGALTSMAVAAAASRARVELQRRFAVPYAASGLAEDAIAWGLAFRAAAA